MATVRDGYCTSIVWGYSLHCPFRNMKHGVGKETNYKAPLLALT